MAVPKVEHCCCDARICKCTVTHRCFYGPERQSLRRRLLSVQSSLPFILRFVEHVFRGSGHQHFAPRQTRYATFFFSIDILKGCLKNFVDVSELSTASCCTRGTGFAWVRSQLYRLRNVALTLCGGCVCCFRDMYFRNHVADLLDFVGGEFWIDADLVDDSSCSTSVQNF